MFKRPAVINVSFDDITDFMSNSGHACIGMGCVNSPRGASEAASIAVGSLAMDTFYNQAKRIMAGVTVGSNYDLGDIRDAISPILERYDPPSGVLLGVLVEPEKTDYCQVTLIVVGNREKPREWSR